MSKVDKFKSYNEKVLEVKKLLKDIEKNLPKKSDMILDSKKENNPLLWDLEKLRSILDAGLKEYKGLPIFN